MPTSDLLRLIVLAALWGASFLFMRIAVPEFGAAPLAFLRVGITAVLLAPFLYRGYVDGSMRGKWLHLFFVGVIGSALPFSMISYAMLDLPAGFSSIVNSFTTVFTAVVGWLWLKDRLSHLNSLGIVLGITGITVLVWDKIGVPKSLLMVSLLIGATFGYAIAANYTKRFLSDLSSSSITAGSQLGATLALLPFAWVWWPKGVISMNSWWSALALGVFCTALAFLLFFRLIKRAGPTRTSTVTLLIPLFGVGWGWVFLDERLTWNLLVGGSIILVATGLVTGMKMRYFK